MKKWRVYIVDFILTAIFFGIMNYLLMPWTKLDDLSTPKGQQAFILSTLLTSALFVTTWQNVYPHFLKWFKQKTKL